MQQLGAWEANPHLAVAVSGGADSMALTLLAHAWCKAHDGSITALTVDHRLRPESSEEAAQVGAWLSHHAITHEVLTLPPLAEGNVQAEARAARYAALTHWCKAHHVLHLLVGHHAGDQAETIAMRQARLHESFGAAGMSASRSVHAVRLVRPLLAHRKTELIHYLEARNQAWVDEPSNQDTRFERVRIRRSLSDFDTERLLREGAATAHSRAQAERASAAWCARHVELFAAGYAHAVLDVLPESLAAFILGSLVQTLTGAEHRPRAESLQRALEHMRSQPTVSLGGILMRREKGMHLLYREPSAIQPPVATDASRWDDRFAITTKLDHPEYHIGALGEEGWLAIADSFAGRPLSRLVLPTLPCLWHLDKPLCVPHIGFEAQNGLLERFTCQFLARKPLAGAPFTAMNDA